MRKKLPAQAVRKRAGAGALALAVLLGLSGCAALKPLLPGQDSVPYTAEALRQWVHAQVMAGSSGGQITFAGRSSSQQAAIEAALQSYWQSDYACQRLTGGVSWTVDAGLWSTSLTVTISPAADTALAEYVRGKTPQEPEVFDAQALAARVQAAVLAGEKTLYAWYVGADETKAAVGACLDALPQSDPYVAYLTQNLEYALCSAGEATDLSLTIAYNPEAVPAGQIVPVQDKAQAARAVRNAWDAGQKSAALLDEGTGWSQDEWFGIGRSALGNARTIVSYAGEGLYQTSVPENAEKRIVLLWEAEQQDKTAVDARRQETEAAIEEAAASLRAADAQDTRERYRAVHDWLCDHVKYDQAIYDATKADAMTPELMNAKSEYGAFVRGKTVCTGYAEGFYALCWRLGLPCAVVYGTQQGEGHAWNAVLVDGEKYFVDCTFDDTGGSRDRYFMFPPEKLTSLGYKLDPYCVIFWEENEENAISR